MAARFDVRRAVTRLPALCHIPATTAAGKIIRLPLRLIPRGAVFRILSGPLRGRRWTVASGVHGYWLGTYEAQVQQAIARRVAPGAVFFDIGAQAGYYTLLAASLVGAAGHVVAFEPDPSNLVHLRRHLRLNGIRNASVIAAAVADRAGTSGFTAERSGFGGALSRNGSRTVKTVTLDSLVRAGTVRAPNYLKIDVEGAELRVLRGAFNVLQASRPVIFLAVHSVTMERACAGTLRRLGYTLRPITPDVWWCTAAPA